MLFYWITCFVMIFLDGSLLYLMLSWNVLLAFIPLVFIKKSEEKLSQAKKSRAIVWMAPWLLFFPNAVYMVTDFIHISDNKFMWLEKYYDNYVYSTDILIWAKLLIIGMGFFFALLAGLESLYVFEQNLKNLRSKALSVIGVTVVSLLSGTGVYIGRFLRFNSWDIFTNPGKLISETVKSADLFSLQFILVFTLFIIGTYILYRISRQMISSHHSATSLESKASPQEIEK